MTLTELKNIYKSGGEIAVKLCLDEVDCMFVQFAEKFPTLLSLWVAEPYDWVDLLIAYPHYSGECNFSKLAGPEWAFLLRYDMRYAHLCNWDLLRHADWKFLQGRADKFFEEKYQQCIEKNIDLKNAAATDNWY